MASVTKSNDEGKTNAGQRPDDEDADHSERDDKSSREQDDGQAQKSEARPAGANRSFFTIYKKGQGYWTRLGTLAGITIIGLMLAWTLYKQVPAHFLRGSGQNAVAQADLQKKVGAGIAVGFAVFYFGIAFYLMNKPSNVDFLIATDTEMKKVNWTSRRELIGSTKVVVFFMFMVAILLFVIDIIFGYLMYWIDVLKFPTAGLGGG